MNRILCVCMCIHTSFEVPRMPVFLLELEVDISDEIC